MDKREQLIAAGLEELTRRLDRVYAFKSFCWRNFGLFKKWAEGVQADYDEKYPLLKATNIETQ